MDWTKLIKAGEKNAKKNSHRSRRALKNAAEYKPAAQLREEGWAVPQDYRGPDGGPLTVHDNSKEPVSDWAW